MVPSTYSAEKTLLRWRRSKESRSLLYNFLLRAFMGLWDHTERHTSAPPHYTSNDFVSIFLEFGVIQFLFCLPKHNGSIISFGSCLLIILILMVTHCCFGCGSLQLQSVKSSLVAWDGMSVLAFHHCSIFLCRNRGGMGLQDCGGGPYGTVEACHCSTGALLKQRDNSGRELVKPHSQNRALVCHFLLKKALPPLFSFCLSVSLFPRCWLPYCTMLHD